VGQARGLSIIGVKARQGASGVELLDILQRKFAGSAEAYGKTAAGAQERFSVALENTQELIGQALLPAITNLLNRASKWLNNQENQKRIQETVNDAVDKGTATANALASGFDKLRDATNWMRANDPFGGKSLKDLASFGKSHALDDVIAQFDDLHAAQKRVADGFSAIEAARQGAIGGRSAAGLLPTQVSGASFVGRALTEQERLNIALGANPDNVAALKSQRALRQKALDFALAQIKAERGNTAKFAEQAANLTGDIAAINQRLAGIAEQAAQKARDAAQRIRDARAAGIQAISDAIQDRFGSGSLGVEGGPLTLAQIRRAVVQNEARVRQTAQFKALGLTGTGDELAPTRRALQAGLASIEKSIGGTLLDTDKNRNLIGRIRRVLSGQFGALSRDVRLKIKDLEDALSGDKKAGPLTPQSAVGARFLEKALGISLSAAQAQRVSGLHLTGIPRGGGVGRLVAPTHDTHFTILIDGHKVEPVITTRQVKRAQRTPTQTRGRQAR
jgi:hypothetical protein